jgi:ABC-type transport system involved in multi-copper enzyme maturation permease subunit
MGGRVKAWMRGIVETFVSPVLVREMQAGMRARRIVIVQTAYLLCLGAIALMVILAHVSNGENGTAVISAEAGRRVLLWLFVLQWVMVVLIAPSFTCSLLSSERERQTWEMLLASLLRAEQIVTGKLMFGVSYVLLLLVSSLPITATAFFLGGVSPSELLTYYAVLLFTGLIVCQLALFFSSREKRTATATNQSYGLAFVLLLLGFFTAGPIVLQSAYDPARGDLATILTSSIDYHGFSFPKSLPLLVFIAWLSAALFVKSANFVRNGAGWVLWLHRLFIYWSVATAGLLAMMLAASFDGLRSWEDGAGFYWGMYAVIALFFLGLFTAPPVLHSRRDRERYRRHLSARIFFFPAWLSLLALLPAAIFRLEVPAVEAQLTETVFLIALWVACYTVIAGALEIASRGRVSYRLAHYLVFVGAMVSPLVALLQMASGAPGPSIWSLYFLSPFTVILGIWTSAPSTVGFGESQLPLDAVSAVAYVVLAIGLVLIALLLSRRRARREANAA